MKSVNSMETSTTFGLFFLTVGLSYIREPSPRMVDGVPRMVFSTPIRSYLRNG